MLNFNSVLVFSGNPEKLVQFYTGVFAKKPEWTGGKFSGWKVGEGFVTVGPHSEVKGKSREPARIMINFETSDVAGEFKRVSGLGAKVISKPYHPGEDKKAEIATLADPDGNYLQLITPMDM